MKKSIKNIIYLPNEVRCGGYDTISNRVAEHAMENLCKVEDDNPVTQCLAMAMEDELPRSTVVVDNQGFMMLQKAKLVWQRTKIFCRGRTIIKVVAVVVLAMGAVAVIFTIILFCNDITHPRMLNQSDYLKYFKNRPVNQEICKTSFQDIEDDTKKEVMDCCLGKGEANDCINLFTKATVEVRKILTKQQKLQQTRNKKIEEAKSILEQHEQNFKDAKSILEEERNLLAKEEISRQATILHIFEISGFMDGVTEAYCKDLTTKDNTICKTETKTEAQTVSKVTKEVTKSNAGGTINDSGDEVNYEGNETY